jgi:hypothetical protein
MTDINRRLYMHLRISESIHAGAECGSDAARTMRPSSSRFFEIANDAVSDLTLIDCPRCLRAARRRYGVLAPIETR